MEFFWQIILWIFVLGAMDYYVTSLSLYIIAKRRRIRAAGLAWVPFVRRWILGCIADQYHRVMLQETTRKRFVLAALSLFLMTCWIILLLCLSGIRIAMVLLVAIALSEILLFFYTLFATRDLIISCSGKCSIGILLLLCFAGLICRPIVLLLVYRTDKGITQGNSQTATSAFRQDSFDNVRQQSKIIPYVIGVLMLFPVLALIHTNYSYLWRDPDFHDTTVENLPHYSIVNAPWGQPYYYIEGKESKLYARPVPTLDIIYFYDPIERYDSFLEIYETVSEEVNQRINEENLTEYGIEKVFGDANWRTGGIQNEIQEKYGIEWHSSRDLNNIIIE